MTRLLITALLLSATCIASLTAAEAPAARMDAFGDALPDSATARLSTLRWRHGAGVLFVAYGGDGKHLLTASQDGTLRLWDADTGREARRFGKEVVAPNILGNNNDGNAWAAFQRSSIIAAALSADGATAASVVQDGTITLWEVASGKQLRQWKGNPQGGVFTIVFTPDGKQLISLGHDQTLRVWATADAKELRTFGAPPANGQRQLYFRGGPGGAIGFSPDGAVVLVPAMEMKNNAWKSVVKRWELATGKEQPDIGGPNNHFQSLAFSNDGKLVVWAGNDGSLVVWDLVKNKEERKMNGAAQRGFATAIAFSPDGTQLATRGWDQSVRVWDVAQGKELRQLAGQQNPQGFNGIFFNNVLSNLAFSPDGKHAACGAGSNTVGQWEVATGKPRGAAGAGHTGPVFTLALAPDGKTALTRTATNILHLWDSAAGKETRSLALPNPCTTAVFSADGQTLFLGNMFDGTLRVWDAKGGKEIRSWKLPIVQNMFGNNNQLIALVPSPDGKLLATRSTDQILRLWEVATGKERRQIVESGSTPNGAFYWSGGFNNAISQRIAFSPDGSLIGILPSEGNLQDSMTGQPLPNDPTIRLWDVATGKSVRRFDEPRAKPVCLVFARDGRTLATGNQDGTVSVWEVASGKERHSFKTGAAGNIFTLLFAPDGKTLVGGGLGGTVGFWDAATGKEVVQWKGHGNAVVALAFATDSPTLISGSLDTTALIWDTTTPLRARAVEPIDLAPAQTDDLWNNLASGDARKAHEALGTLCRAPEKSVALLQNRFKPVPALDGKRLHQLLDDLESEKFPVRHRATLDLEKFGELAEPDLKRVLAAGPPLDARLRLERLLDRLMNAAPLSADDLRAHRALEILESIGTSEARSVLETIAGGAGGARVTVEAKAALQRLAK